MYRVVHHDETCAHYNERDDRECYLETGAVWLARIHNGLIHGVDDSDGPCATVHDDQDIETRRSSADRGDTEVLVDA